MKYVRNEYIERLAQKTAHTLAFSNECDFSLWKKEVRKKLNELLGMSSFEENVCPLNVQIEKEVQKDDYKELHLTFESEVGAFVPCYLLIPNKIVGKLPVCILLQGHCKEGAISSIGEYYDGNDTKNVEYVKDRGDFAVQAVKHGYIALALEQRGMGSRTSKKSGWMCNFESCAALLFGRTILGGRVWDISRAIDVLAQFPQVDMDKIIVAGTSGGGTATYYAACYDQRIKLAVPNCGFSAFDDSILYRQHCFCNYIPSMYNWFDMQDVACLIAPRKLVIIAGEEDDTFLIEGVQKGFKTVQEIYNQASCAQNCKLVITPKGHYWCKDIVWDSVNKAVQEMGWRI